MDSGCVCGSKSDDSFISLLSEQTRLLELKTYEGCSFCLLVLSGSYVLIVVQCGDDGERTGQQLHMGVLAILMNCGTVSVEVVDIEILAG